MCPAIWRLTAVELPFYDGYRLMKREFVINRHGKDYVLYAGLLDVAHQQGLRAIKTQLLQVPTPENGHVAICLAEVTTEKGTFTGIGDAEAGNVNRMMANALIRMAETRAKARALRDAVNVGLVAIEELAESATDSGAEEGVAGSGATGPLPAGARLGAAGSGAAGGSGSGQPPAEILPFPGARHAQVDPGRRHAPAEAGAGPGGMDAPGPAVPETPAGPGLPSVTGGRSPARGTPARQGESPPLPPTQTQLETIAKLARSAGRTIPTEGLTRAAASELITRLSEERYGARRTP